MHIELHWIATSLDAEVHSVLHLIIPSSDAMVHSAMHMIRAGSMNLGALGKSFKRGLFEIQLVLLCPFFFFFIVFHIQMDIF